MIYTPKFLSPKGIVIDGLLPNTFKWETQGEPQTHYQLKIYKISDNSLVYDSTKKASAISSHLVPAMTLTNNQQYKWVVEVFGATGSAVSDYVFLKTYNNPTVSLIVPATITTQSYKFTATYYQAENVSLKQYRFILYDNNNKIIEDTEWQYGFTPSYTIDGLLNGNSYKIECRAVSQSNIEAISGKKTFTVQYALPDAPRSITVKALNDTGVNEVNWGNLKQVTPVVTGTSSYVDSKFEKGLKLNAGAYITYSEQVNEYFTKTWHTAPLLGYEGLYLKLDEDFIFGFENNVFYVINQNVKFISDVVVLESGEDIADQTFTSLGTNNTWLNLTYPTRNMKTYLFVGLTFNNVIVKKHGKIIARIDMKGGVSA